MSIFSKIAGGLIFFVGLLFVIYFPSSRESQPDKFAMTGILFGLGLMGLGVYLMIF